jgi:hypothetical protein
MILPERFASDALSLEARRLGAQPVEPALVVGRIDTERDIVSQQKYRYCVILTLDF